MPALPPSDLDVVVEVLGPLRVRQGDEVVALSATQRRLLARLAIGAPDAVGVDELFDALWDGPPPASARAALNNQVSRVRARLGATALETSDTGVALALVTDAGEVAGLVAVAELALEASRPLDAFDLAAAAAARWRGVPLVELGEQPVATVERRRLAEVRRAAENLGLAAALDLGRLAWATPEAERLVAETPHDEERWAMLVRALDRAGRRGDALAAYERARRTLADDLGLLPGERLRAAEAEVLGVGRPGGRGSSGRLVGRQALLSTALRASNGGGHLLLTGEAGAGKTALLHALGGRLRRTSVALGVAEATANADAPLAVLSDLLEAVGATRDPGADPVAGFAAAVGAVGGDGPARRIVLLVDDLDRVGPTSAAAIAAAAAHEAVTVIATARDGDAAFEGADIVALPPLALEDVATIAGERLAEPVAADGDLVQWLAAMSGGNPLLLETLLEQPNVDLLAATERPVGAALGALVRPRVAQLDAPGRYALEVASVGLPELTVAMLAELSSPAGVEAAVAAGFLVEWRDSRGTPRMGFRHGAVQRIVHDDLAPGRRVEGHHVIASHLREAAAPAASIARHALAAATVEPRAAADAALLAARDATAHGAHADAAAWCRAALPVAEGLGVGGEDLRVALLVARGDALRLAGSPDHEAVLFEAADAALALGEPALVGAAAFSVLQLGATTESGSHHERGIELAGQALAVVQDPEQRALIGAAASLAHSMTGSPELCRQLFLDADAVPASAETRARILPFAYLALGHPRDLDRREEITAELHQIASDTDDPVALFEALQLSFSVALQRADGPGARDAVRRLEGLVLAVGDVGRVWALRYMQAALAHLDDDLERAEALAEEALTVFTAVSPSRAFATYGAQVLVIRVAQGRVGELLEVVQGLVADQPGVPAWHAALALASVDVDPDEARRHAGLALERAAPDFTWLASHVIGGRAAATTGDPELIAAYRAALAPWTDLVCWQGTCAYGPVAATAARLAVAAGDRKAATTLRRTALRLARALDAPVFERDLDEG